MHKMSGDRFREFCSPPPSPPPLSKRLATLFCASLYSYDARADKVYPPHKQAQVYFIRGLIDRYKMPCYVDFDQGLAKAQLISAI